MRIAVLFAADDSVYKKAAFNCDVWDRARDARRFRGRAPVVAHPPCGKWAGLRHQARRDGERRLALFALRVVRRNGGVLEHPSRSRLWPECKLPMPGEGRDRFGGFSIFINQSWFGHRAAKPTLLYIVGVKRLPLVHLDLTAPRCVIGGTGRRRDGTRAPQRKEVAKRERAATPPRLAAWLLAVAKAANV